MEIGFNNKSITSLEVRLINVEITKLLREKNIPPQIMQDEKRLLEILLDHVASQGQRGTSNVIIKYLPDLRGVVAKKFREHVEAGNAVNVKNYQECFDELKNYDKELVNIAHLMARKHPASLERHRIVELLKERAVKRA